MVPWRSMRMLWSTGADSVRSPHSPLDHSLSHSRRYLFTAASGGRIFRSMLPPIDGLEALLLAAVLNGLAMILLSHWHDSGSWSRMSRGHLHRSSSPCLFCLALHAIISSEHVSPKVLALQSILQHAGIAAWALTSLMPLVCELIRAISGCADPPSRAYVSADNRFGWKLEPLIDQL